MSGVLGPLSGMRVIEFSSAGPVPFCGMALADLGADVTVIERPLSQDGPMSVGGRYDLMKRGKRMLHVDLKSPGAAAAIQELAADADVVLEGYRPGTMERLGLGPLVLQQRNPRLIYCRVSGRGQTGPLAGAAGHDLNFLAESGALYYMGPGPGVPLPPLNLVADFGGGGMLALVRVLAAIHEVRGSGIGQCIDVSIVEGCKLLMASVASLMAAGKWEARGGNVMDGSCPWYAVYATSDQGMVAVASVEPKYYRELLVTLGLTDYLDSQLDRSKWGALRAALEERFHTDTLAHWELVFSQADACVSPVVRATHAELAAARFRQAYMPSRGGKTIFD